MSDEFDPSSIQDIPVVNMLPKDHELVGHAALADFKGIEGLVKSFIDTQKMVGLDKNKLVALPPEGATPEQLGEFYTRLGRPDTADDYTTPEDLVSEDGFNPSDEMLKSFFEAAHAQGLNNSQAGELLKFYSDYMTAYHETLVESNERLQEEAETTLRNEWGSAYQENLTLARKALQAYGDDGLVELLDTSGLGSHPSMVRLLQKVGEGLKEDMDLTGKGKQSFQMTPEQASSAISQKYADENFMKAYGDAGHPNHNNAVSEMSRLFQMANPG